MDTRLSRVLLCAVALGFGAAAWANDMQLVVVTQAQLPKDFQPSKYDNSPRNYDNSLKNYENSPDNFDNSDTNPDNSVTLPENGPRGNRRLVFKDGDDVIFLGYYIRTRSGVTNIYAPIGKRMFYNPKKSRAVFGADDGEFYGAMALKDGQVSLVLTEEGVAVLEKYQPAGSEQAGAEAVN